MAEIKSQYERKEDTTSKTAKPKLKAGTPASTKPVKAIDSQSKSPLQEAALQVYHEQLKKKQQTIHLQLIGTRKEQFEIRQPRTR